MGAKELKTQKSPHSAKATRGRKVKTLTQNLKDFFGIFFIIALLFPVGLQAESHQAAPETITLMVELRRPTSLEELHGARAVRKLSNRAPREYVAYGEMKRARDLRNWRAVKVAAIEAEALKAELVNNPAVVSVREELIYEAAALPNDPRFSEQIGLHSETWPLDINAPEAWDTTTGSSSTVIAVVDGGVDIAHEDLRDKIWVNSDEVAGNGVDDDGNGFIDDVHGWDFVARRDAQIGIDHATHVAGIAAASSNNSVGVAGVDWGARIMSVRVLGSGGFGGESNIIEGINYAVAKGADVINLSIAGPSSQALIDAVENAYASGVVVVAAAGNSGIDTARVAVMPGCADANGVNTVLGVGALDDEGVPANFSNYGKCVDVSAPGKDILSTKVGNRYGTMKGTSMSSPFVAGVAGLYLALHPNAGPAEVIGAITGNMTAFVGEKADEWNAEYKGRLNAAGVVGPVKSPDGDHGVNSELSGDGGSSGGGGGDSGGGDSGGGGGGGGSEEPQSTPKPKVAGAALKISAADRKAPDFIQNKDVPATVAQIFQSVWGRKITPAESLYWKARARSDKPTETKLLGAMLWWKLKGKSYDPRYTVASR